MRESFRDLPRSSQLYTFFLALVYSVAVAWGLRDARLLVVAGLAAIFAASNLVEPLPNPTGGQLFPNNSVKIVAALLWQPSEVMLGVGLGSFLGLSLFRRSEVWRASSNGLGWGIASGAASFAAHLIVRGNSPGLAQLGIAALFAVAMNRVVNEGIFSVYRAQRFGRPFLSDWLQNVWDQWFSQILAAPMAIVLAAAATRTNELLLGLVFTLVSVVALPIPRQELAYYHRALQMIREVVEAMVRALEGVDQNARAHGDRVSTLSVEVGRRLGMSERHLRSMQLASRLYDVGKLAGLEEPSSQAEGTAAIGGRILSRLPDPMIATIVRNQNERWDGRGLPDRKKGKAIPLGARILAAAKIYDSSVAGLPPYDTPLPKQAAFSHLLSLAGTVLDPKVVITLLRVASEQRESNTGATV